MEKLGLEHRDRAFLCSLMDSVSFFNGYSGPELEQLSAYFTAFQADMGAEIFAEGEPGSFLCVVVDGAAEVLKEDHRGVARVVARIGRDKTLGEMALIDEEPRSATARVTSAATLLVLTRDRFERMCADHPRLALQFALRVARLLSRRLRLTSGMLVDHLG